MLNRPHGITASAEIPPDGAEGVLLCQGTAAGGYSFFVKDKQLHYVHNYLGREMFGVHSDTPLEPGTHELRFEYEPTGSPDLAKGHGSPGRMQLYVDGDLAGAADIPYTTPLFFNPGGLVCGANPGSPITPDYAEPFAFTGTLHHVTVDLSGDLITDDEAELRLHMARQ